MDKQTKQQILTKERLLQAFFRLIQTAKIHEENNRLLKTCAEDFISSIEALGADDDHISIQLIESRIWIQGEAMVYKPEIVALLDNILHYFELRKIQGIRLDSDLKKYSFKSLMAFIHILNQSEQHDNALKWLVQQIKDSGFSWVELLYKPETSEIEDVERKERAKKSYVNVLASVREVADKLCSHRPTGLKRTIRVIQNMVDLIMEDDPLFTALSTIRIYDDYTYTHSVNVAILSMCIGKRIMLSERSLERLGLCGVLHDLGKVEVREEILKKPGKLTPEEFEEMKRHTINSVRLISKINASRDHKARIMLPPFEHHLKFDLSGYPETPRNAPQTLFGRILTIADVYDAITSPRVYRLSILSPDRALGMMLKGAGKDFDPILLKVFINMLGVYPVGTLLKLDKGVGLVKEKSENSDGSRPKVIMLVKDANGNICKGDEVDLSKRDPKTGKYLRTIVGSYHPTVYGINASQFLL